MGTRAEYHENETQNEPKVILLHDSLCKGINETILSKGINETILSKGINETILSKGVNETILSKGINETILSKGINETILSKGINETILSKGINETILWGDLFITVTCLIRPHESPLQRKFWSQLTLQNLPKAVNGHI